METPLTINQGSTWIQTIIYKDSNDDPIDLTNYSAKMEIKESYKKCGPSFSYLTISTNTGEIVIDGPTGTITITVDYETTQALRPGVYVYDFDIISPDVTPVVTRLLEGKVTISPGVTNV